MKAKAVGYIRVSGNGQVSGTGFDRQRESIQGHAKQAGYELINWYEETHTGTDADRPIFTEMVEDLLANGARVILIESMDRLARDLVVSNQLIALLIRKGITLISATTGQNITESMAADPMLKALIQIQSVFAELEKSLLVRKLAKARKTVREQKGRCEGRKPFGYRPGESEVVKRIRQLYRKRPGKPRLGYYKIATQLNREKHPTRTGKPWTGPVVRQILERR
jgi:site-specific DNA recombinase